MIYWRIFYYTIYIWVSDNIEEFFIIVGSDVVLDVFRWVSVRVLSLNSDNGGFNIGFR